MKLIFLYGTLLGILLLSFKLLEYQYFSQRFELDTYLGIVSVIFLGLGLYFGKKLRKKFGRNDLANVDPAILTDQELLSARELDVLKLIARGYTNQQISDELFISMNTTKTHLKNIFAKLDVKSRTQALFQAKQLKILK